MTLPAWPSELPRPSRASWSAQLQDPRARRSAENGPPGYRRRFSSAARLVTMEIEVSRNGKAVFDTFHADLAYGSLPFTMPDPTTDGWPLLSSTGAPLLKPDGTPILLSAEWVCLFGEEMPSERIRGVNFFISFPVAVMP